MARSTSLLHHFSGMLGNEIVFKQYYDKTVISVKPDMSKRVLSPKQIEWNERMMMATNYAKLIYKNEEYKLKARIRLKVPAHKSLFHALVKEHLDKCKHLPVNEIADADISNPR
jgi:hypothetical protein